MRRIRGSGDHAGDRGATVRTAPGRVAGIALLAGSCALISCGRSSERAPTATAEVAAQLARTLPAGRAAAAALPLPVPRRFDLSHVEPGHFAAALGKDVARIFNFVRDEVAFEPYAGSLRGARGTLLALAGNSTDRAALLAALLTSAGSQVRFVVGTLADATATDLVTSVWDRPLPTGTPAQPTDVKQIAELDASIRRNGALIADSLKRAGHTVTGAAPVTLQSLVAETRNHFWVEVLQNGTWMPMDPSFPSAAPGQTFAPVTQRFTELPEALFHRITLRIHLEEYQGTQSSRREALTYTARAADLSAVDIFLQHQAGKGAEANRVMPVLVIGKQRIAGSPFWLRNPPGRASAAAADALGGGEEEPGPLATAESIEMEFTGPNRPQETVVRDIFDRIGKHRRSNRESLSAEQLAASARDIVPAEFASSLYDLFVTTGAVNAAHLASVEDSSQPPGEASNIDLAKALRALHIGYLAGSDLLLSRLDDGAGRVCRFYLDTPRVHIADVTVRDGVARLSFDLRRDHARALVTGFRPEQLFRAQILRGVVDGSLERAFLDFLTASSGSTEPDKVRAMSTSLLFETALAQNVPTVLLSKASTALTGAVLPDARARIDGALSAESFVITPIQPIAVNGRPRMAWWQVDQRSGVTTAVTDEGLHQNTVELHITTDAQGSTITFTINGTRLPSVRTTMNAQQVRKWAFALGDALLYNMRIWMTISGIWS